MNRFIAKMPVIMVLALCFVLGQGARASSGSANLVAKSFSFEEPSLTQIDGELRVNVAGCDKFVQVGAPLLPVKDISLLIPPGKTVASVRVTVAGEHELSGITDVEHARQPFPLSRPGMVKDTPRDASIYGADELFPAQRSKFVGLQLKHGYSIATVRLFPVQYRPVSGRLVYVSKLNVELELKDSGIQLFDAATVPHVRRATDASDIAALVANPDDVAAFAPPPAPTSVAPAGDEGVTSNDYVYVIITTKALAEDIGPNSFQELMNEHIADGLTARIVTIGWINGFYPAGDQPNRIRNFIRDAYDKWGTRYVLLGGDADLVPPRHFRASAYTETDDIPADLYYACLDGTFDGNGNGIYGEPYDGADKGYGGSDVDLLAEVTVGRAAVTELDDVHNFVRKTLAYKHSTSDALTKAVMLGEHLGFGGVAEFAKNAMEQIRMGGNYDGYYTTGFEDSGYAEFFDTSETIYDQDHDWAPAELIAVMNDNRHIFNHLGHCNRTHAMKLEVEDLPQLNNNDYFFVYSQGCMPGWFDRTDIPCFAQVITTMDAGAFAVVMNARYGWGARDSTDGPSQRFDRQFWDSALGYDAEDGVFEFGWMNQYSKERNIARINEECMRWCTYELNLFGDPALQLQVERLHIDLDRLAYRSDATVEVTLNDFAMAGATNQLTVLWHVADTAGVERAHGSVVLPFQTSSSRFVGSFVLTSGVTAVDGDLLTCSYSNASSSVEAVAPIDDFAPVITNVRVTAVGDDMAVIEWDTDESSDSYVWAGLVLPPSTYDWQGSADLIDWGSTNTEFFHKIMVEDLASLSHYYYVVRSTDAAGNAATYPVDITSTTPADYPDFITRERVPAFSDDMEEGTGRWSHDGLKDIWEYGVPSSGPLEANSGSNCWATRIGGQYDDLMNAWLVSPPIWVGDSPRISFYNWYAIDKDKDFGYVEVNGGLGWQDLTMLGGYLTNSVTGTNDNWQKVTIRLPDSLANCTIQTRFRLLSDNEDVGAGWYIDDFSVIYAMEPGLSIAAMVLPVNDSPTLSAANDGDGYPEPGETVLMRFRMVNTSGRSISGVTCKLDCPAAGVSIVDGTDVLNFGTVSNISESINELRVVLDSNTDYFTKPVTFFFHVNGDGGSYTVERTLAVSFQERDYVSGRVVDTLGASIDKAVVTAESAAGDLVTAETKADGSYLMPGLLSGETYRMWADMQGSYSPSDATMVTVPSNGVDFVLGRAFCDIEPASFRITMKQHDQARLMLRVANTNTQATLNLDLVPTSDFDGQEVSLTYTPTNLVVAPGGVVTAVVDIAVECDQVGLTNGVITLAGNAVQSKSIPVPVEIMIVDGARLSLQDTILDDADGDGFVESGELCGVNFDLANIGLDDAAGVTGLVSFAGTGGVTVTAAGVAFGDIPVQELTNSSVAATFRVDAGVPVGTQLPFVLDVWDADGIHWQFDFSFTVDSRQSVWGTIMDIATPRMLDGVTVRAYGADGTFVGQSDSSGEYHIYGLSMGTYTVRVDGVSGYGLPPAKTADTTGGDVNLNFNMWPMDVSLSPSAVTLAVDEGRSTSTVLRVSNDATGDIDIHASGVMVEGTLDPLTDPPIPKIDWNALSASNAVEDVMIVRFKDGASAAAMSTALGTSGLRVLRSLKLVPACLVAVESGSDRADLAASLAADDSVEYVQPNYRYKFSAESTPARIEPNDVYYGNGALWGMDNRGQDNGTINQDIDAPEAWAMTRNSSNVVVAVIDSGCDIYHPDLRDNLWVNPDEIPDNGIDDDGNGYVDDIHGWNFVYGLPGHNQWTNGVPLDDIGHGTHVAGTIGAVGDNGIGVVGVNWHARIMVLKIADSDGVDDFATVEALEYAILKGARVSNNSWGGSQYSPLFHDMIQTAMASNHLVVCAAGNESANNDIDPHYPAADPSPNVVAVAACDRDGIMAWFSNYGASSVDIAAPGVDIISTVPFLRLGSLGNAYTTMSGTSMASPHVAGVATLLAGYAPGASWRMLKDALMMGTVKDASLAGTVVSSGHLNALRSLQVISAGWLEFEPEDFTVAGGGWQDVKMTVNSSGTMSPGVYKANAVFESGVTRTNLVPVSLTVNYAPIPTVDDVRVDDSVGGDGDGFAEPGEDVKLFITLRNTGSLVLDASSGTLKTADAGVTITDSSLSWSAIDSMSIAEATVAASVHFAAGSERDIAFTLDVSDGGAHPAWKDLPLSIHFGTCRDVTGKVSDGTTGAGLSGVEVVYYGINAGSVVTDSNGNYRIIGVVDGTLSLRAEKEGYGSSDWTSLAVSGADGALNFQLYKPEAVGLPATVGKALNGGMSSTLTVAVTNGGSGSFDFRLHEMRPAKIAVYSDTDRLFATEAMLSGMGFEVSGFGDNLTEAYTENAANFVSYDICIVALGGDNGLGRKYSAGEVDAFKKYLMGGGKLILTGRNLLGSPDNRELADLLGSSSVGLQSGEVAVAVGRGGSDPAVAGIYCNVNDGDTVVVDKLVYDAADDSGDTTDGLLEAGSGYKVMRSRVMGGELVYWSGNQAESDWADKGVLRDMLKNIIADWQQEDISWLQINSPLQGAVPAGGSADMSFGITAASNLPDGTNTALVLVQGNLPGTPDRWLKVELIKKPITLAAKATTGVTRWDGTNLEGNGNDNSCIYQLISAGANGVPDAARPDGSATGDDTVLRTFDSAEAFGRFGDGFEYQPDHGKFARLFSSELTAGTKLYVRAWDAKSFALAVAYGDSSLYELSCTVDEEHDFGSWVVGAVPNYPASSLADLKDINQDSIPDGWAVANGLDPRDPIGPLDQIVVPDKSFGGLSGPRQVVVESGFVFVADTDNNRVLVLDTNLTTILASYTGAGTPAGALVRPRGIDFYIAGNRLVVADTDNFRIVLLDVNPTSGALSYAGVFGSRGDGNGEFDRPLAVAVAQSSGRIFVVDSDDINTSSCNHRVQRFSAAGSWELTFGSNGDAATQLKWPQGISIGRNGFVYIADSGNNRIKCVNSGGTVLWVYGDATLFSKPRDVREGPHGWLYVADTDSSHLVLLDITAMPISLRKIADYGEVGSDPGQFRFPQGVYPMLDGAHVYVADTLNNRIQRVHLVADGDHDGMEDLWEYVYYSTIDFKNTNDWAADPDGDGIINLGEYRAGTDPLKRDTNNNGASDGDEMAWGRDPISDGFDLLMIRDLEVTADSLHFNVESGGVYQVESTTNLINGRWISAGSAVNAVSNGVYQWSSPSASEPKQYYRIRRLN